MTGGKVIGKCRCRHNSSWWAYLLFVDFNDHGERIYAVQLVKYKDDSIQEGEAVEKYRGKKIGAYDSFIQWINF